jgi:hypothetical protein
MYRATWRSTQDRDRRQATGQTDGHRIERHDLAALLYGEPSLLSVDAGVPAGTKVK